MDEAVNMVNSDDRMEIEGEQTPWAELQPIALEKIYSFLGRKDRGSMAQVCVNWYKEYNSPSLWRDWKFYLPEYPYTTEMHPEVLFTLNYGHFFHHVQITCRKFPYHLVNVVHRQLKSIFHFLARNSQLLSVSVINLNYYLNHLNDVESEDFRLSLRNFLMTQRKLRSVIFKNSQLKKNFAIELLQEIFSRNSRSLKELVLEGYVDELVGHERTDIDIDVHITIDTFMNLKILSIEYSHYFEIIITSFYEYRNELNLPRKGALEKITLLCDGTDWVNYNRIQPAAWKYFRQIFPALRIDMCIENLRQTGSDISVFVVREIPLKALDIRLDSEISEFSSILRHLIHCDINKCLESLSILESRNATNFVQDLINFLQMFDKLKELQLYVVSPVDGLHILFEHWLENCPNSLKTVHISIRNVRTRAQEASVHRNINAAERYEPLLQLVGLTLTLQIDRS